MSIRWSLVVSEETDRSLRSYLARTGGRKGDLSRFVDRAVRQAIFWETLEAVWERNKHLSPAAAQALADRAVADARADRVDTSLRDVGPRETRRPRGRRAPA